VSAYACEPEKGSEAAVGWNWVRQSSRFHEVWVITRANNRGSIERALAKGALPNVHWVYFDLPRWARFWKQGQCGVHAYYYLWQLGAYYVARKLHREVGFDLVHHVTFVNYWMPSFLVLLPVPFVWGPVGGGESAPATFWRSFSFRGKVFELLRDAARRLGETDPSVKVTARRAAAALAATHQTEARLQILGCRNVSQFSQVGLPQDEIRRLDSVPFRQDGPFRLVSVGNLLHWKGFKLGLHAFARFRSRLEASQYWIIGDGPEREALARVAGELGVAGSVKFWGAIPRQQVLERLRECDVLVHPSLHDSGGWVCLEAMAAARPVVCLDLGGPALQVTEETGIRVPAVSPEQVVTDLSAAIERLAKDPTLRVSMGNAARQRVREHFDWDQKGALMMSLYESVRNGEEGRA
jgi:glycosyltransferase involved in cell wall biosynthesis